MAWWSIGSAAVGAVMQVSGQQQAKKAAREDANFAAGQQRAAALRATATGQRAAANERRNARLIQSALQARAGGGGLDPTVVNLAQGIAGEGEYRALTALYEGESAAAGLNEQADAAIRTGRAQGRAMDYKSAGTILSTASSMASRYGGGKPPSRYSSAWGEDIEGGQ